MPRKPAASRHSIPPGPRRSHQIPGFQDHVSVNIDGTDRPSHPPPAMDSRRAASAARLASVTVRPFLTRLLAVLLLMQWGSAFAHCLRLGAPAAALHVEICTAEGLRIVAITPEGEDAPAPETAAAFCPACLGPAAAALPAPEVALAPPLVVVQATDPPPPAPGPTPFPPRSCQPRAPPPTS